MGDNVGNQLPISAKNKQYAIQFSDGSGDLDAYSNLYARNDSTQGEGCISATCYFGDGGTLSNIGTGNVVTGVVPQIAFYSDTEKISSSAVADITSSNIAVIDGTAAAPTFTFKDNPDTGICTLENNHLTLVAGGVSTANVTSTAIEVIDGTALAPSFAFTDDTDTGICTLENNHLTLVAGGVSTVNVTSTAIEVIDGTALAPSFAFTDSTNTGIYQTDTDNIAFSCNGRQKITMGSGTPPTGMIDGLNVGITTTIAGIRRISANTSNSWEDGHLGNSNALVFTPSDFTAGDSVSNVSIASSQPDPVARNSRWYGTTTTTGILVAQKIVPKGFIIDGTSIIHLYTPSGTILNTTCYVSGQGVSIGSINILDKLLSTTTFSTNSDVTLNGRGNIIGDGLKMVTIYWDAGTALTTGNGLAGALITMKRI